MNLFLTGSLSFAIAFFILPAVMRVARDKKLFDVPDARKLHTKQISSLGGVGIFIGFLLSLFLTVSLQENPEFQYFYASSLILFFMGIKDDIIVLSASKKFLGQILVALIIVHLAGLRIDSMHGLLGIYKLPVPVSNLLSYFAIIVIVNAFNLIDGIDGLSSSLGILTMAVFGTYFAMANLPAYAMLSFGLMGALCAFLVYNYHPAKIFMGDSGSLVLGLINAVLVIKFINMAESRNSVLRIDSAVAIGFAILIVPLFDTLRVFTVRILSGRSPFSPDRNHIHHLLLARGFNHSQVTLICLLVNAFFIVVVYASRSIGTSLLLLSMLSISCAAIGLLKVQRKRQAPVVSNASFQHAPAKTVTKIVSLTGEEAAMVEQ